MSDYGKMGGVAALIEAATFVVGIVLAVTLLAPFQTGDLDPVQKVAFIVDNQAVMYIWNQIIYLVFGVFLVVLALALYDRLKDGSAAMVQVATVYGLIWAGLMYATGMISNIGIEAIADLAESDPDRAVTVWSTIDTVTNGLGGGNELVSGIWILLVSIAGLLTARLPRWLNVTGIVTAVAGLITVVPDFEAIEMVFGLGSIVWFIGVGVTLLRDRHAAEMTS